MARKKRRSVHIFTARASDIRRCARTPRLEHSPALRPGLSHRPPACARSGRPPPLPPTCWATKFTNSPRGHLLGEIFRNPCDQTHFAVVYGREHNHGPLEAIFQSIHGVAQRRHIRAIYRRGNELMSPTAIARSEMSPLDWPVRRVFNAWSSFSCARNRSFNCATSQRPDPVSLSTRRRRP